MNVSIVIPAYNEVESLRVLLPELVDLFDLTRHEVLVVWDGPDDGTAELCASLGCSAVQGEGKGLGAAIQRGIETARYDLVVVMDGDGQHPAEVSQLIALQLMLGCEFIAGTRVERPGLTLTRRFMSWGCKILAKPLTPLSDPMTGLFGLDRRILPSNYHWKASGWKVGLQLAAIADYRTFEEVEYTFEKRIAGESNAGWKPAWEYLKQIAGLYAGKIDFTRMAKFCVVGTSGVLVNLAVLTALVEWLALDYRPAAIAGIGVAMLWNYGWNAAWTFRRSSLEDRRRPIRDSWHLSEHSEPLSTSMSALSDSDVQPVVAAQRDRDGA